MELLFLTKDDRFLIGWIANIFGYILNFIFEVMEKVGIVNMGLTIILFTILTKLLLMPLSIKQQRFARANSLIAPELNNLKKKYQGKQDRESQMKYSQEMNAIYAKYQISPFGGCLPILIQFPIFFALYAVVSKMPAYINDLKAAYVDVINIIVSKAENIETLREILNDKTDKIAELVGTNSNKIVDMFKDFSSKDWAYIKENVEGAAVHVDKVLDMNSFLSFNLSDTPGLAFPGILFPIAAVLFAWLQQKTATGISNVKEKAAEQDTMGQTTGIMMKIMPFMSGFITIICPIGLGLYWIMGSIFAIFQQLIINKYLDKHDKTFSNIKNVNNVKVTDKKNLNTVKITDKNNINKDTVSKSESTKKTDVKDPKVRSKFNNRF